MTGSTLHGPPHPARRAAGFTLVELMAVVAVIAILAAIAVPGYQEYVRRSHRAEARAALQQGAAWLERSATAGGSYPLTADFPATLGRVGSGRYAITLASPTGAVEADAGRTWTLTATRVPGTAQAQDRCGDFTLTESGQRGVANQRAGITVIDCWDR